MKKIIAISILIILYVGAFWALPLSTQEPHNQWNSVILLHGMAAFLCSSMGIPVVVVWATSVLFERKK